MPAIYHEGSWLGNATDPEVLVKDTVGWTGKNRLNIPDKTLTSNGVTININNGVASFSGTNALSSALWIAGTGINIPKGTYIFSGLDTTQSIVTNLQLLQSDNTEIVTINLNDSSKTVIIPNDLLDCKIHFRIVANGNTNGIKAYPMLRRADITDPTYEPYHESVEEEIEQIYADNGVLGAKNLMKYNAGIVPGYTQTSRGITCVVNDDYSVTANGTREAGSGGGGLGVSTTYEYPPGDYIVSGCPQGGSTSTYMLYVGDSSWNLLAAETGSGARIHLSTKQIVKFEVHIISGITVNNLVFKPMLRLASDPDDTYQPHAMTNRELTNEKINIADLKTVVSASSDFTDFKTRIASL